MNSSLQNTHAFFAHLTEKKPKLTSKVFSKTFSLPEGTGRMSKANLGMCGLCMHSITIHMCICMYVCGGTPNTNFFFQYTRTVKQLYNIFVFFKATIENC